MKPGTVVKLNPQGRASRTENMRGRRGCVQGHVFSSPGVDGAEFLKVKWDWTKEVWTERIEWLERASN